MRASLHERALRGPPCSSGSCDSLAERLRSARARAPTHSCQVLRAPSKTCFAVPRAPTLGQRGAPDGPQPNGRPSQQQYLAAPTQPAHHTPTCEARAGLNLCKPGPEAGDGLQQSARHTTGRACSGRAGGQAGGQGRAAPAERDSGGQAGHQPPHPGEHGGGGSGQGPPHHHGGPGGPPHLQVQRQHPPELRAPHPGHAAAGAAPAGLCSARRLGLPARMLHTLGALCRVSAWCSRWTVARRQLCS